MKLHHLLILCVTGFLFGSCKYNPGAGDSATVEQLFPLTYGNYWTFHARAFDANGNVMSDTTQTLEVFDSQNINGRQVYFLDQGTGVPSILYYSGNDVMQIQSDSITSQGNIFLHYPMYSGEVRTILDTTIFDGFHEVEKLKFIRPYENITVPAGSFSCYHFEDIQIINTPYNNDTQMTEIYLSPGVGLIQIQGYGSDSGQIKLAITEDLVNYHVK